MKARRTQEVRDTSARGFTQATCDGAKLINQRTGLNFGKGYIKELITISTENNIPCVYCSSGL